jgi:hypothetical protein
MHLFMVQVHVGAWLMIMVHVVVQVCMVDALVYGRLLVHG